MFVQAAIIHLIGNKMESNVYPNKDILIMEHQLQYYVNQFFKTVLNVQVKQIVSAVNLASIYLPLIPVKIAVKP